jgi:hypothetical protein
METFSQYFLKIAGVNHFDPAIRSKLVTWLKKCLEQHGSPNFVAVEWSQSMLAKVKAKRPELMKKVSNQWKKLSVELLETLTLSLGYEGDTHLQIFPNVKTVWLDDCRTYPNQFGDRCALRWFNTYKRFLNNMPINRLSDSEILYRMSAAAAKVPPPKYDLRDSNWADIIKAEIGENRLGWGIVIVGNDHILELQGSMTQILRDTGILCHTDSLL